MKGLHSVDRSIGDRPLTPASDSAEFSRDQWIRSDGVGRRGNDGWMDVVKETTFAETFDAMESPTMPCCSDRDCVGLRRLGAESLADFRRV